MCNFPLLMVVACVIGAYVRCKDKVYFPDLEHLNVTYWNPKYYSFMNYSARRYNRQDPIHYLNLHYETLIPFGNTVMVDVYVYEFLSNEYRRSFVEVHYKLCDFIFSDPNFGVVFLHKLPVMFRSCPFPKAVYRLENISFPNIPLFRTFPFQKGRVFVNYSHPKTNDRIVEAYVDLVVKSRWQSF